MGNNQENKNWKVLAIVIISIAGAVAIAIYGELNCDEDCQEAREVARIEKTVVAELEKARTVCESDFDDWRTVERFIKDATRYPKTFEWESKSFGRVGGYYKCATGNTPYHRYWTWFNISNPFGVPERHMVVVYLNPDRGSYTIVVDPESIFAITSSGEITSGEVIGYGIVEK